MKQPQDSDESGKAAFMLLEFASLVLSIGIFVISFSVTAYLVGHSGVSGGSIAVATVDRTSIGVNLLGAIALVWSFLVGIQLLRKRALLDLIRPWAIVVGLFVALFLLVSTAKITGGEEDVAGSFQIYAMIIAYLGFWFGFRDRRRQYIRQALLIFFMVTLVYWSLDLSAIPVVIANGAPRTNFAGGGLTDSDFVYPFGAAVGYYVSTKGESVITSFLTKRFGTATRQTVL